MAFAAVCVVAAMTLWRLAAIIRTEPGLPLWDEASQSLVGAQLLDAARALRPLEFLRLWNDQVVWPFVHGALLVPWMALAGDDRESAARLSAALVAALPLAAFLGGTALHPTRGAWAGLFAAALLMTAPLLQVFGTLGMLEAPGAFLVALTFALHARSMRPGAARGWTIAAGVSTAALVLLKYNYGLLWLGGLLLFEWRERSPRLRGAWLDAARAWFARGGWRRPMPLVLGLYALALAAIFVTGGGAFDVLGQRVSVRSPGNPAYGLLLLASGSAAVSFLRDRAAWRAWWQARSERTRVLAATIGIPLLAWFLIPTPNRVRALVEFSINRSTGPAPWSLEGLFYYPEAFARDYAAASWLGWVVLALALIPPRRIEPPGARLAWSAAVVGLLATAAHRYHDPRFLFTTAVPIALSAAARLTGLLAALAARMPRPTAAAVWTLAFVAAIAAPLAFAPDEARVRAGHRAYRGPEALGAPLDFVLKRAALAPERGVLLGVSNPLSPALLEWRARERGAPPRKLLPRRARSGDPAGAPVFAAMPLPGTTLDAMTHAELDADRRAFAALLARTDRARAVDTTFAAAGVRVVEFRSR